MKCVFVCVCACVSVCASMAMCVCVRAYMYHCAPVYCVRVCCVQCLLFTFSAVSVILYLFYFHALSFFLSFPLPHSLIQMLLGMFPGVSMWHMRSVTDVSFV